LPNGHESTREVINHPGGVAVVAFKDKDTILLVEQFRKPIESNLLELPAGKLEYGEDPETCGIRELEEETGYKAKSFSYLGKIVTSPGFCDEYIYLYKAEDLFLGNMNLDEDEFLNVKELSLDEVKENIVNGKIIDAKTICAIGMISIK
jgi:ADP-ribose pyrophosphatase